MIYVDALANGSWVENRAGGNRYVLQFAFMLKLERRPSSCLPVA